MSSRRQRGVDVGGRPVHDPLVLRARELQPAAVRPRREAADVDVRGEPCRRRAAVGFDLAKRRRDAVDVEVTAHVAQRSRSRSGCVGLLGGGREGATAPCGEVRLRGRSSVRCAAGGQRPGETTGDGYPDRQPAYERCHATVASALATGRTAGSDGPLMCIVGAASRSTMRTTITTALTAMPAATRKATWYACAFGRSSPPTRCMTPIAEITVLRMATPTAPPSWRPALNMVDARPVVAGVTVANAA